MFRRDRGIAVKHYFDHAAFLLSVFCRALLMSAESKTVFVVFNVPGERLNNVVVGVTNSSPNVLSPTVANVWICGQGPAAVGWGVWIEVACTTCTVRAPEARYVALLSKSVAFTVCEVMVFGIPT